MHARVLALIAVTFLAGWAGGRYTAAAGPPPVPPAPSPATPAAAPTVPPVPPAPVVPEGLSAEERRDIDVFRRASESVVFITSVVYQRDFFSLNVQAIPQGSGSGFLWDAEGHIVTNFHVVENAARFAVTLSDQSEHEARLVGVAPDKDLAVLKLVDRPARLVPIVVGRSAGLLVGQRVLAVGNPFGLDHTLTTGVVSALGREIDSPNKRTIRDVIQTDAAINPGNSGGPLLDSSGRLIGINTAIFSPSGSSAGIGFAVPADTVARLVPQLIKKGRIPQPGIGIAYLPDTVSSRLGLQGVVVTGVQPDSPAARAGISPALRGRSGGIVLGDVLVAVNGKPVRGSEDLLYAFEEAGVGQTVMLTLEREAKKREVPVELVAVR